MTSAKVLLPVRVPELGPSLGRLLSAKTGAQGLELLDGIRYKLGTRIIECGGEARRLAAKGERSAAVAALGREIWKQAWDEAVGSAAQQLIDRLQEHLQAEAIAVRMGRRRRARLMFGGQEERALMARLGATGAGLVLALDELQAHAGRALAATGLEPHAMQDWRDALGTASRRLEAAWHDLERAAQREIESGIQRSEAVAGWRKPVWPVLVVAAIALPAAAWFGLVLGGYIPAPDWLTGIWLSVFGT